MLKPVRPKESQTAGSPYPEDTFGVLMQRVDIVRRQPVLDGKGLPLVLFEFAQSVRRGKPHGPARRFQNRRNRIRSKAARRSVRGDLSIFEPADPSAQSSRPYAST